MEMFRHVSLIGRIQRVIFLEHSEEHIHMISSGERAFSRLLVT